MNPNTLRHLCAAALLCAGAAATAEPPPAAAPLTIERMFAAPDLSGPALRAPKISPDGRLVTYLQGTASNKDRLDLWAFDLRTRSSRLLVDSTRLAPAENALSAEEEQRRERQRSSALSGIIEYEFSSDSRYLLIPLSGDLFLYDLRAPAAGAVRQLTATDAAETDARFSPLGHYVSFVREQNLFVIDLRSGREQAITRDGGALLSFGMAEFIAQEEMDRDTGYWWSPDDTQLAFTRVDESTVDEVERFEIYADRVKVVRQRYPAAGRPNARVELYTVMLAATPAPTPIPVPVRMDLGADADIYLARVDWFPDNRSLAVQRQTRDQRQLDLLRIDARSGAARTLLSERSEAWVDLHHELTFLPKTGRLLWASSRSGYKHLYLYDFDGRLLGPATGGPWMLVGDSTERAIRAVDEARGLVYFMGNRETPLERHLYVAPLGGGRDAAAAQRDTRRVSREAGWHSVQMSKDARVYLDTFSDPQTPPSLTLRGANGRLIQTLVANPLDATHPYFPLLGQHLPTEYGTLPAADGQILHYQIIRPRNLVPGRRYPVIVDVYGGPSFQRVRRSWLGGARSNEGLYRQILAQRGYIVFTLDNRGSGSRGTQFETALHRRMGSVEVEDQVRGVDFLRTLPYVDAARVGVFGWSYGGYMALMCMMRAPEHFAAGVAGAPVTDWSLYDTHYTERYMQTPASNPEGYRDGNVMSHAANLRGPLLIMHGMADDNVLFTHSTALFKQLQDLRKPFDVMPYPGSKHGLLRFGSTGPHSYETITRFFDERLQPQGAP